MADFDIDGATLFYRQPIDREDREIHVARPLLVDDPASTASAPVRGVLVSLAVTMAMAELNRGTKRAVMVDVPRYHGLSC